MALNGKVLLILVRHIDFGLRDNQSPFCCLMALTGQFKTKLCVHDEAEMAVYEMEFNLLRDIINQTFV